MPNDQLEHIQKELQAIKARNERVEANKAWETSPFRIGTICLITYATTTIFLYIIGVKDFYLAGLVPAIGFLLSHQSLPYIKNWWIRKYFNKK